MNSRPVTRRLFFAIPSPPEITGYMKKLKEANQHIPGIKWMRLNNLHLTVYFIGNIISDNFENVVKSAGPVIRSRKSFTLEFEKISLAPSMKPRMIWARFYQNHAFKEFSTAIHNSLQPIIPENKFYMEEPVPHITLARFHRLKKEESINLKDQPDLSPIKVTHCELYESVPSPEGVKYISAAPPFYLNQ